MRSFALLFAVAFAMGLNAQSIATSVAQQTLTVGDTATVFYSQSQTQTQEKSFSCLTQVQVVPTIICAGNTATMTSSLAGGNPLLVATWYVQGSSTPIATNVNTITVNPVFTTTYHVVVTCPDGTTTIVNPIVFVNGIAPALSAMVTNATCGSTGAIDLTVGPGNFWYVWSSGQTTQDLTNLPGGNYSVIVTNPATGCTASATYVVMGGQPPVVTIATTNVSCFGFSNGSATATITGTGPFTYLWSNGQINQTATGLAVGTYTVTVTGPGNCSATATATITQPSAPVTLNVQPTNPPCGQFTGGSINLTVSGGTGPYTYSWASSAGNFCFSVQDLTNLPAGTYSVTVTDANGCTNATTATIVMNASPNVSIFGDVSICQGETTSLVASGNAVTYQWGTGIFSPVLSNVGAGIYSVTATAMNGCTATASVTVTTLMSPTASISQSPAIPQCPGQQVVLSATGVDITTYSWNTGATTSSITVNPATTTTYFVTVTNSSGCKSVVTKTVMVNSSPVVTISTINNTNGSVTLTANPAGMNYFWTGGVPTQSLTATQSGTYAVTVTNANNCSTIANVAVAINTITVVDTILINCNTDVDGDGFTVAEGDCNDNNTAINPAATEICDGTDNDCDGQIDEGLLPIAAFSYSDNGTTTVSFSNQSQNSISWFWTFGDGVTSTLQQPGSHTYPEPGQYTVILTALNACGSNTTTQTIFVDEQSTCLQILVSPNITICAGQTVDLSVIETTGHNDEVEITWFPSYPGIYNHGHIYSVAPTITTTYTVVVSFNGCTVSSQVIVYVDCVNGSTDQALEEGTVVISPNPTADFVKITNVINGTDINIFNASGQLKEAQMYLEDIDMRHLPAGVYFLQIKGRRTAERVVKIN